MEGNNRRAEGEPSMADLRSGGGDWLTQLHPEARQQIVNMIMETLKLHLPISVPERLNEWKNIAVRFEEKTYDAATNPLDYLRKIFLKMLSMEETQAQPSPPLNQPMSNSGNNRRAQSEPSMADLWFGGGDWRTQLHPEARQQFVNTIMETLKLHLPISVPERLNEWKNIAVRFEEKTYDAATNPSDYLQKIFLKMLKMEETQAQPSPPLNQPMSNSDDHATVLCLTRPNKRNRRRDLLPEDDRSAKRNRVEEPTFSCPICMNKLVSPCSTTCGHIFCEGCIKAALHVQKACPTCRTRLIKVNSFHRVYLPTLD